ncbi:hypothetical protein SteCoe_27144 [Stentor coeruleus]|uniref:J domain-containing protein n=1 Tax=Stentor coeruleus TaxID=5963 RepID=A0A1R2BB95_9CILI|nr:hypothetical protein SteCoe_27144 [Stentor coeruleus]
MIRGALRALSSLDKVSYVKVPIIYPKVKPQEPNEQDYEILKISPQASNREIIMAFRELSFAIHPTNNMTPQAAKKYAELVEAYDRIALHRMAENGVPQPYTEAYYPPKTNTKVIKEFLEENSFYTPHVSDNYVQVLFVFWGVFGLLHTLCQIHNPFLKT